MKFDSQSSDVEIGREGNSDHIWEYSSKNVRDALVLVCRGSEGLVERLVAEAQKQIDGVRATFGGRAVNPKEVHSALGAPKGSLESLARSYAILSQEK